MKKTFLILILVSFFRKSSGLDVDTIIPFVVLFFILFKRTLFDLICRTVPDGDQREENRIEHVPIHKQLGHEFISKQISIEMKKDCNSNGDLCFLQDISRRCRFSAAFARNFFGKEKKWFEFRN